MIQIAIFSDVHGNLPALDSVLKDIKARGIQHKFCLGDLIDFAPWGNEVIEKMRSLNILCLMGNHDERIAFDFPVVPLSKHSEEETEARFIAIDHSKKHITKENKKFLSELPFHLKLNYKVGKKHWNIQLVHSSLSSNDTYLYESEEDEIFIRMLEDAQSDVIVMGHTHLSFKKQFENNTWAINCGSVGRSKEENRLASYLVLTLDEEKITPEIIQIPYPIDETVRQIKESGIPDYYALFLKNENVLIL
ncbi:metallophosphoesterase family protein [Chryseobacterium indologenes]|uniref:metallophosphoesterase family protein n=1 Tax=Chryseobacterium indologenes TaxID=253 RepID=UPI001BCAFBB7|nr:metallophosphoesterase family protein [Chryseobacterium indologenes]